MNKMIKSEKLNPKKHKNLFFSGKQTAIWICMPDAY